MTTAVQSTAARSAAANAATTQSARASETSRKDPKGMTDRQLENAISRQQRRLDFLNRTGRDRTEAGKKEELSLIGKIRKFTKELFSRRTDGASNGPAQTNSTQNTNPTSQVVAPVSPNDPRFEPILNTINGLEGKLEDLFKQLNNPDLKPGDQARLNFQIQRISDTISMLRELISNLMKKESDTLKNIVGNIR